MSYCRWGSDSYRSDVYVYESGLGFQTHVASAHPALPDEAQTPDIQLILDGEFDQWRRLKDEFLAALDAAPSEPVHPGWAGKDFVDDEPGETANRLELMRADGLHVPDGVIEALRAEERG